MVGRSCRLLFFFFLTPDDLIEPYMQLIHLDPHLSRITAYKTSNIYRFGPLAHPENTTPKPDAPSTKAPAPPQSA